MLKIMQENGAYWLEERAFTMHGPYDSIYEVGYAVTQILLDDKALTDKLNGQTFYVDTTHIYIDEAAPQA